MKFKMPAIALLVCLLLLVATPVFAQPPLPHMFYGSLTIGGEPAPAGTVVEARGTNVTTGIQGNPVSTTVVGQYGSASEPRLYVQGPNINNGDIIEFYINGAKANETHQFQSGAITELNLTIANAPPPLPASFVVTDLTISPAEVESGETVTIEAEVTNSGGNTGDYTATLKINGAIVDSISLTLEPGESQTVSFSIAKETAGSYTVQLDGLESTFTVTVPTEPAPLANFIVSGLSITPEIVEADAEVTISVLVTNTGSYAGSYAVTLKINGSEEATEEVTLDAGASEEVTFTTKKDTADSYSVDVNGLEDEFTVTETPPPPPESPVNWPVVGGTIAGIVIVGLLIFFLARRRAY